MYPNRITICRDEHDTIEEFKQSMLDIVHGLIDNGYTLNMFYDDKGVGVVCIDFDYKNEVLASVYPYWLALDEADLIDETRREQRMNGNYNE